MRGTAAKRIRRVLKTWRLEHRTAVAYRGVKRLYTQTPWHLRGALLERLTVKA